MYFYRNVSDEFELTDKRKKVLQSLVIDSTSPGPLLHDIDTLLNRLVDKPLRLTATQRLSRRDLPDLNAGLHQPLNIDLKRPQQKSYPPLLGLYFLLRASGLTHVDESGKENQLKLNDVVYDQWQNLNATERYGHLLESWFLRGNQTILGESGRRFDVVPDNFQHCAEFVRSTPAETGKAIAGTWEEDILYLIPERHNLGLMVEFGWIQVQSAQPDPGSGWKIERVKRTEVGMAMLSALYDGFFSDIDRVMMPQQPDDLFVGNFQEFLQPYLSDWQKTITFPDTDFRAGMYTFHVSLESVWRRIEISGERLMSELAMTILIAFEFDSDHLYEFTYRDRFGRETGVYHPHMDDWPIVSETRVGDVPLTIGQTMTFTFDFGDNWEFKVVLENIDTEQPAGDTRVIESHGKPPEQYTSW